MALPETELRCLTKKGQGVYQRSCVFLGERKGKKKKRNQIFRVLLIVAERFRDCYFTSPVRIRSRVGHAPRGTEEDCLPVA